MNTPIPKLDPDFYKQAESQLGVMPPLLEIINLALELQYAQQETDITAEEARERVIAGDEIECFWPKLKNDSWDICVVGQDYPNDFIYRAIKQAQPEPVPFPLPDHERAKLKAQQAKSEPVDPHAALRAEYIRQRDAAPCELRFYLWERKDTGMTQFAKLGVPPAFFSFHEYRCTDISCYVAKQGEPAVRMLRSEAQELQRKLGDTVDWFTPINSMGATDDALSFIQRGTYTHAPKASIKLDGKMVTPEQAAAEWEAKRETCNAYVKSEYTKGEWVVVIRETPAFHAISESGNFEYELRPKALKHVRQSKGSSSMTPTPAQIAEWRNTAKLAYFNDGTISISHEPIEAYVTGYIRARTEQATEIEALNTAILKLISEVAGYEECVEELKAKLAEVMPLAKFGAMVLRSQEFETELAVKCGFLVPNLKAGGYLYTIDQATIERILKD